MYYSNKMNTTTQTYFKINQYTVYTFRKRPRKDINSC